MKVLKLFLISVIMSACCEVENVTKYIYGKVVITRIDECDRTTFYYGDEVNENLSKIWVEYSGINDGFKGYLQFHENGEVSLLSGEGYFQVKNLDSTKFNYTRIQSHQRPKIGENVCYLNLATKFESEDNISEKSGVRVEYLNKQW